MSCLLSTLLLQLIGIMAKTIKIWHKLSLKVHSGLKFHLVVFFPLELSNELLHQWMKFVQWSWRWFTLSHVITWRVHSNWANWISFHSLKLWKKSLISGCWVIIILKKQPNKKSVGNQNLWQHNINNNHNIVDLCNNKSIELKNITLNSCHHKISNTKTKTSTYIPFVNIAITYDVINTSVTSCCVQNKWPIWAKTLLLM